MDSRIEQVLDGTLSRDRLTREELAELNAHEALLQSVLLAIPEDPMPDLSGRVLRGIELAAPAPAPRNPARTAWSWLWQSRSVTLRPAYAFAAAAVLIIGLTLRETPQVPATASLAAAPAPVLIQFRLDAPDAQQVSLAGDFTGWKPEYQLLQTQTGVWTIVVPLQQGMHEYAFIVDGERWVPDPHAPFVQDGFGGENSRVAVIAPDARSL